MNAVPEAWFCLRAQRKHEHIAAAHLSRQGDLQVYLPRIRFKRATKKGPRWRTEPLFPSYLFARFDLVSGFRRVRHTPGVQEIVHFGGQCPAIPDHAIEELRAWLGPEPIRTVEDELRPGDEVRVSGGVFNELRAVVTRVMPGRQRVAVLLDFLGRQTAVELAMGAVVRDLRDTNFRNWGEGENR